VDGAETCTTQPPRVGADGERAAASDVGVTVPPPTAERRRDSPRSRQRHLSQPRTGSGRRGQNWMMVLVFKSKSMSTKVPVSSAPPPLFALR
jgi:hypothetical protein